jgi:very-long-chain enoyl-CoA reductase
MPVFNLFKNCAYYWGFAAFVSYFVNHPLYTAPPALQTHVALALAMLCELANARCARPGPPPVPSSSR